MLQINRVLNSDGKYVVVLTEVGKPVSGEFTLTSFPLLDSANFQALYAPVNRLLELVCMREDANFYALVSFYKKAHNILRDPTNMHLDTTLRLLQDILVELLMDSDLLKVVSAYVKEDVFIYPDQMGKDLLPGQSASSTLTRSGFQEMTALTIILKLIAPVTSALNARLNEDRETNNIMMQDLLRPILHNRTFYSSYCNLVKMVDAISEKKKMSINRKLRQSQLNFDMVLLLNKSSPRDFSQLIMNYVLRRLTTYQAIAPAQFDIVPNIAVYIDDGIKRFVETFSRDFSNI